MKKGFTLVELMIVVAIIGILAAIAIPNFVSMQYRAKRAEVPSNVDGIKTAQVAYEAAFDSYVDCTPAPTTYSAGRAAKTQKDWDATAATHGFSKIGWGPDGRVRGQYKADDNTDDFYVEGICDVDGDSNEATYTATKSINATMTSTNNIY